VRKSVAPLAALAGSLALTLAAAAFLFVNARMRDRARFARAIGAVVDRIDARLHAYEGLLRGCAGLLAARPELTADEFHAYVSRLEIEQWYPGVQGVGYAQLVRPGQAEAVENTLRARGFVDLRIWPESGGEERTAVVLLEPLDRRNRAAIGYDMFTDAVRRDAMQRARDAASAAISSRVILVQEIDPRRQAGFLMYVPVYQGGEVPPTPEARRSSLIGWAYAPFRADDLFVAIFGMEPEPQLEFRVYDGPAEDPARLLHDRGLVAARGETLAETEHLEFGGREWTLAFTALPSLGRGSLVPTLVALLAGGAISVVVSVLSRREADARRRAEDALAGLQHSLDEQRRYEVRLREESRINSILRRLGISLAAELDPDRLAQLVTDEATALTGADFGAMFDAAPQPRLLASARRADETFGDLALQKLARVCGSAGPVRIDAANPGDFDGARVGSVLAGPITLRTGQLLGGLAFVHRAHGHFTAQHERLLAGIAAQASIALENARLLRDLQEADRRKDEFLAVLGHELRNPLAPVVTALEVMKRDRGTMERQLAIVERQARHMVRIVDELLDVSRISRGKIELRKQQLSVREAIAKAADSVSPMARSRGQKLTVSFPQRPLAVDADPVRLEQILGNLLSNAIKYTPDGGEVELSARERDGQLELRVRDTGIGIPPESMPTLFQPFVQVAGAKDYAKGGLGIGLALVRGLVELHGGTVEVESAGSGQGATFSVLLPGVVEGATPLEVRPLAPAAHRGRVLVVDDNVDAAVTLAEGVALEGHEVRVAHDGPSALDEARAFSPEVILLDIGLPGMDGYEVVRRLRELPQARAALIVALTGFGQQSDRQRALGAGFDEHLVKPVELDTVTAVLRRRLGAA
jgi:signal transduction histidine kinase/CHASE1-domain containing sensor protein/ActR/RegA family two-component response regulator